MAQRKYNEGWLGRYDSVEVYRDNFTCSKRFKYPEEEDEADAYFNYLQSLDNQETSIKKQDEIIKQLKRQNDLAEQQLKTHGRINTPTSSQNTYAPTYHHPDEYWSANHKRILDGIIYNEKDLRAAEKHFYEDGVYRNYKVLLALAKYPNSNKLDGLNTCATTLFNEKKISKTEYHCFLKALLNNPKYEYKHAIVNYLIENLNTESQLRELLPYCKKDTCETNNNFVQWLNRMQQLGFLDKRGREREIKHMYPVSKSGCSIWFVMIISTIGFIISQCL